MLTRCLLIPVLAFAFSLVANAQTAPNVDKLLERLEKLENDNRKLLDEIHQLRNDLASYKETKADADVPERLEVQESRTAELAQTKVEASQRWPISLTGMLLFNSFLNGKNSGTSQYPVLAGAQSGMASSGASLRQTVLGLRFNGPDLPGGGKASGSLYMDFYAGSSQPFNNLLHLRVATLDLNWKNTTVTVGQDKPIISPREPSSLAQVGVSPLTAAGNLWDWQPQARVEQRFALGEQTGFRAQAGVYETNESATDVPTEYAATVERWRPGFQGRVEFYHARGSRRIEIAPGFHFSTTHVTGTPVPSRIASLDWLIKPASLIEFSGAWFRGENVAVLGSLRQGFAISSSDQVIPVHSQGGWGQIALFPSSRLSLHFYAGQQDDRASDLVNGGIDRNLVYAGNFMYRLAPNVVAAFEASQTRTTYITAGTRLNNHYDLALAYMF
jgi:hypothetical protein